MDLDKNNFFREVSLRIFSALDIDTSVQRCFDYIKNYLPLDELFIYLYEPDLCIFRYITSATTIGDKKGACINIPLPQQACSFIEKTFQESNAPRILNRPELEPPAKEWCKLRGLSHISQIIQGLQIEGQRMGFLGAMSLEENRYTKAHADLISILHEPFAMAMANTLQHQKTLRLMDMLDEDKRFFNQELQRIGGDRVIGAHLGLKTVMQHVEQVAPLETNVLLLGETGVGKEVIANAIHFASPRDKQPFIKVNCGAIPDSLIDSELFGHEKGSFTNANAQKRGFFERANHGTIFLDEIGDLPLSVQARLLRVIQHKEIQRVGGTDSIPLDIRIIAATNCNLEEMVQTGSFRKDLWFRISVFPIVIPPLRERIYDIPLLVDYFLQKKSLGMHLNKVPILSPGAMKRLQDYHWPGNVRELEILIERELIKGRGNMSDGILRFYNLQPVANGTRKEFKKEGNGPILLDDVIACHIRDTLEATKGRIRGEKGAATLLGVNPSTLRSKMKKLGIRVTAA